MTDKELIMEVIKQYENSKGISVLEENIQAMNKLLKGNGNIGLCETIRTMDTRISYIHSCIKQLWAVIGTVCTLMLAGLVKIIFFS